MKKKGIIWNMLLIAIVAVLSVGFTSCSKDDDKPEVKPEQEHIVLSLADQVSGTYSGRLKLGDTVREDAYIIKVSKLTNTTVAVEAKFFGDEPVNFNLVQDGNQIAFSNATLNNFNMYYSGGQVVINYLSAGGDMLTYTGTK